MSNNFLYNIHKIFNQKEKKNKINSSNHYLLLKKSETSFNSLIEYLICEEDSSDKKDI